MNSMLRKPILPLALLLLASLTRAQRTGSPAGSSAGAEPIHITADLSDAPRKIYHAEIDLPVRSGPLTLTTPKWIPGNHRPTGPVADITGVIFTANGQTLPWRRDEVDMYAFHLTIPAGVTTLHAHLDCIATARISQKLAVLEWEKLLLYPAGLPVRDIPIQPAVIVPHRWGIGTALSGPLPAAANGPAGVAHGDLRTYSPTTVEQLEDSPIITGQYFHEFALAPDIFPAHFLDVVADRPEDSNLRPEFLAEVSNLVREASAMYSSHHYNVYHFLLTLSDVAGGEGLEHGQSSDNGVGERDYSSADRQLPQADLLAHEFTHSWNGKYRRPAGLYQPDFTLPEHTELLWVYEGMTQYLGNVLAARSGLKSQQQYRDLLALSAAALDAKPGRDWRNTEDTAIAASVLRASDPAWSNLRRGQDYYQEGELLWLDVDTTIRKLTGNQKNLRDFLTIFLAKGGNTGPLIVTYDFKELVADLNQVVASDWEKFLNDRITALTPHVNTEGIEQGGYRLVYTDEPTASERTYNTDLQRGPDVWYSLGLRLDIRDGIQDVRWGSPADKAGLAPGQKLIAINGVVAGAEALHAAIVDAKSSPQPIHLIVQSDTFITTVDVDYHGGELYPHLQRIEGTPAWLDDITAPLTQPPAP